MKAEHRGWFVVAVAATALFITSQARAVITAGDLLVNLDATDAIEDLTADGAGPAWPNLGTLGGSFNEVVAGSAGAGEFGPQLNFGIIFNGTTAVYQGPAAPAAITGNSNRTIEVWEFNPSIGELETLVGFGRRNGPEGSNLGFSHGINGTYGAVGHWGAPDTPWTGGVPAAGQWHHLVYSYDGSVLRLFADGVQRHLETMNLGTHAAFPINLGAKRRQHGSGLFGGERFSGAIARVRIHDGALTKLEVISNFNEEAAEFGLWKVVAPPAPVPAILPAGPIHRYQFNGNANDSVGGKHGTVVNPLGTLASFTTVPGSLDLRAINGQNSNSADTNGAYVDLPNGMIKAIGTAAGGAGQGKATFEAWVTVQTNNPWAELFSWGRSNGVEGTAGDASAQKYITLIPDNGASRTMRLTHRSDGAENFVDDFRALTTGVEHHVVVTWDEVAGKQALYLDGVQLDTSPGNLRPNISLAALDDINNWLGRSQWGDPLFDGLFNEFRIYNYALNQDQVLGNFLAGANVVNAIPEPASAGLALLGVVVVFAARRARRQAA